MLALHTLGANRPKLEAGGAFRELVQLLLELQRGLPAGLIRLPCSECLAQG